MKTPRNRHIATLLFAASITLGSLDAPAQSPAPAEAKLTIPDGPLLQSVGAYSEWVITYSYVEERTKKTGSNGVPAPLPDYLLTRPRTVLTTKTRNIVHEEYTAIQGDKFDLWSIGTIQYSKASNSKTWYQVQQETMPGGNQGNVYIPLPTTGFRDLDWINADTYVGTMKYGETDCLVFVPGGLSILDLSKPSLAIKDRIAALTTVAFINANTRFPIEVRNNGEIRYFQFHDSPTAMQIPPSDLVDQIKSGNDARARLYQPAARPY